MQSAKVVKVRLINLFVCSFVFRLQLGLRWLLRLDQVEARLVRRSERLATWCSVKLCSSVWVDATAALLAIFLALKSRATHSNSCLELREFN
jgi:hypothetical protein